MKRKRSRLAVVGVLALALSVTVGLVPADAAKKKKKKTANVAFVSNTTPRAIPDSAPGPTGVDGRLDTTLTVGKKFKGKTVGQVDVTFQTTGDAPTSGTDLEFYVTAPNGFTMGLYWETPTLSGQNIGPLTLTPNSPVRICTATSPPCSYPYATLNRPYAGTAGEPFLALFRGVPMKGNWVFTVLDDSNADTSVLNSVALKITAA